MCGHSIVIDVHKMNVGLLKLKQNATTEDLTNNTNFIFYIKAPD